MHASCRISYAYTQTTSEILICYARIMQNLCTITNISREFYLWHTYTLDVVMIIEIVQHCTHQSNSILHVHTQTMIKLFACKLAVSPFKWGVWETFYEIHTSVNWEISSALFLSRPTQAQTALEDLIFMKRNNEEFICICINNSTGMGWVSDHRYRRRAKWRPHRHAESEAGTRSPGDDRIHVCMHMYMYMYTVV